jgi:hypothetical protein
VTFVRSRGAGHATATPSGGSPPHQQSFVDERSRQPAVEDLLDALEQLGRADGPTGPAASRRLLVVSIHDAVAGTTLSSVRAIVPPSRRRPSPRCASRCSRPRSTVVPARHRDRDADLGRPDRGLNGPSDHLQLRADFAETVGLTDEAQAALDELRRVAAEAAVCLRLGYDRRLLRTFVTRDLARSITVRPGDGRIVDTDYSVGPHVLT